MRLAIFDLDGTLLANPASERAFFVHLLRRGRLGPRQAADAAAFLPRWACRFGWHVFKKDKAYLAGLPVDAITAEAEAFAAEALAPRLRSAVAARATGHRRAGNIVMLLTGSPDFLARPLASAIGAERWRGTTCATRAGRFTADPPIDHPFGRRKLEIARDMCRSAGAALEDCTAYANSIHDLDLLSNVGYPVAVDPDRRLARIAHRKGWPVMWPEVAPRRRLRSLALPGAK